MTRRIMAKGKRHTSERRPPDRRAAGAAPPHQEKAPAESQPKGKPRLPAPHPPRPHRPLFYFSLALFACWMLFLFWMAFRAASP